MSMISEANDNKIVTVGGIITAVRSILTKKGDKMAFVKIENKTDEAEFIVFPSVFAEYGGKLEVDNVVKVRGRVNAKDKNGNVTSDVKLLAETIELISDEVLESYKSTGSKLGAPVAAPDSNRGRKKSYYSAEKVYGQNGARKETPKTEDAPRVLKEPPKDPRKERLYILVEDADNTEVLTGIRKLADLNLGMQEVVLVLKDGETKRPLKMPFKVDVSEELLSGLKELVGEDKVKVC